MARLLCKKSLFKSTYEGNAFNQGVEYEVVSTEKDNDWTFVRDEEGQAFGPFVRREDGRSYVLHDYFVA